MEMRCEGYRPCEPQGVYLLLDSGTVIRVQELRWVMPRDILCLRLNTMVISQRTKIVYLDSENFIDRSKTVEYDSKGVLFGDSRGGFAMETSNQTEHYH